MRHLSPFRRTIALLLAAAALAGCGAPAPLGGALGRGGGVIGARGTGPAAAQVLMDDVAIFPAARKMLEGATRDIQIDMFFMGGKIGREMADIMVAKKKAGLDVKLMYDPGMGYHAEIKNQVAPVIEYLRKNGVQTMPFPVGKLRGAIPIKADHNKALIVDGREAMVGGMNFSDINAPNHDMMIKVQGPAALELKRVFKANWTLGGGDPTEIMGSWQQHPGPAGEKVEVTTSGLAGTPTRPKLEALIDGAKERIWVQMFVLADDRCTEKLVAAAKRGVDVRVLLDPSKFAFAIDLQGMPNLGAVVKFRGSPVKVVLADTKPGQQMHVKAALFDRDMVAAGSTNWTQAGFDSNNETTLIIKSEALNAQVAEVFMRDWPAGTADALASGKLGAGNWFKGKLADWVSFLF